MSSSKQKKDKSSAKIATTGFISFSDVAGDSGNHGAKPSLGAKASKMISPVYTGDNGDLAMACKKILKRDMTTKLKALNDTIHIISASTEPAKDLQEFLPFFTFAMSKLAYDDSWQVRERTGQLLLAIIEKDKQSLGPFMKDSIGPWWQLSCDPVKEVAEKFSTAFMNAIPPKRRPLVLVHLSSHLLKYMDKNLRLEPAELKEMTQCTDEELDDKYERLIASVIDSIGKLMQSLSSEQNTNIAENGVSSSADLAAGEDPISYRDIVHSDSLLKHFKSKYLTIRRSCYQLLVIIAEQLPTLLLPHSDLISQFLLSSSDEKNDVNLELGLLAIVKISSNLNDFWNKGAMINQLIQKMRVIRKSKPEMLSNFLLPILSSIPAHRLGVYTLAGEDASKGMKIFQSFLNLVEEIAISGQLSGTSSAPSSTPSSVANTTCALETLTFLALRKHSTTDTYILQMERLENLLKLFNQILMHFFQSQLEASNSLTSEDFHPLMKSISAFHRNTVQQTHINSADWNRLLWMHMAQELCKLQLQYLQSMVNSPLEHQATILEGKGLLFVLFQLIDGQLEDFSRHVDNAVGLVHVVKILTDDLLENFYSRGGDSENAKLSFIMFNMNVTYTCGTERKLQSWCQYFLDKSLSRSDSWLALIFHHLKKSFAQQDITAIAAQSLEKWIQSILMIEPNPEGVLLAYLQSVELHGSIEGLYLLLHTPSEIRWKNKINWSTSLHNLLELCGRYCLSPSLLHEAGVTIPSQWEFFQSSLDNRDGRFKINLLLNIATTDGLENVGSILIDQALKLWSKKTSRVAVLFLFHIVAKLLQDTDFKKKYENSIIASAEGLRTQQEKMIEKLQSLFFGRDRNTTFSNKYHDYVDNLGDTLLPLDGWQSIEELALPTLDHDLIEQWLRQIGDILNSAFEGNQPTCSDEFGTEQDLKPSKWARHVKKYLMMQQKLLPTSSSLNISIKICDQNYWKNLSDSCRQSSSSLDTTKLDHILSCALEFFEINGVTEDSDLILQLTYALACVWRHSQLTSDLQTLVQNMFKKVMQQLIDMEQEKREEMLLGLMKKALLELEDKSLSEHCYGVLRHLLVQASPVQPMSTATSSTILNFPLPSLIACKGREGFYISQQAMTSREVDNLKSKQNLFENYTNVFLTPMKLQSCHLENGPDHPYYSLQLQQHESKKELQTEWNRILLDNSQIANMLEADSIVFFQDFASVEISQSAVELQQDSTTWTSKLLTFFQEMFYAFKLDMLRQSTSLMTMEKGLDWTTQMKRLEMMTLIFPMVASTTGFPETLDRLIAEMRGLVLLLTGEKFIRSMNVLQTVKKLVQVLCSSTKGLGNGLWVSYLVKNVYLSPVMQQSSKELSSKAMDITAMLHHTTDLLAHVLSTVECNSLYSILEHKLLPSFMQVLDSDHSTQYASTIAKVMKVFWKRQAHQRSVANVELFDHSNPVKAWEISAFKFLFEWLLAEATRPQSMLSFAMEMEATSRQWEAVLALHFAMLGRTRESASHMMRSIGFQTHSNAIMSFVLQSADYVAVTGTTSLTETYRIGFCKLLDQWLVSGELWDHVQLEEEEEEDKKAEVKSNLPEHLIPHSYEEFEQDDPENEARDRQKDADMFKLVLGEVLSQQLLQRFDLDNIYANIKDELYHRLSSTNSTEDSIDEGNVEKEEDEELAEEVETLLSISSRDQSQSKSGSVSSNQRPPINKKVLFKAMVKMDGLGSVFTWLLSMQAIDAMSIKHWSARARCGNYLRISGLFKQAMDYLVHLSGDLCKYKEVASMFQKVSFMNIPTNIFAYLSSNNEVEGCNLQQLAIYALFRTICTLPAMFRNYWNDDCKRVDKVKLSRFIEERVRLSLLKREVALIHIATNAKRWDSNEFVVKGNTTSGEICATFFRDETKIEITIKMPPSYPLKNVEVDCTSRIGVSDGRWRRWVLQMIQLLSMQDGSVVDAALLWKSNIEKEMDGVEPCPICYCILHTKTLKLPTFACPTCKHKFHPTCLHTWFKTSGKSKCVLCQQPIFL